jgi:hypothetical protein
LSKLTVSLISLTSVILVACASNEKKDGRTTDPSEKDYAELSTLNLDEMQSLMNRLTQKAMADGADDVEDDEATAEEGEVAAEDGPSANRETYDFLPALRLVLSRPNGDNMVSQLLPGLRSKIRENGRIEPPLSRLVDESLDILRAADGDPGRQATRVIVLENILAEFKPEVKSNVRLRAIFEKIRDANIDISKSVISDLRLRGMYRPKLTPSQIAEKIIGKRPKAK